MISKLHVRFAGMLFSGNGSVKGDRVLMNSIFIFAVIVKKLLEYSKIKILQNII